jgi:predicted acyl esterase
MNLKESNRWVKRALLIPWNDIEKRYAALFTNRKGNVAAPAEAPPMEKIEPKYELNSTDRLLYDYRKTDKPAAVYWHHEQSNKIKIFFESMKQKAQNVPLL